MKLKPRNRGFLLVFNIYIKDIFMNKKFEVSKDEKQRILELHESIHKNNLLSETSITKDPSKKETYPLCVQGFGEPSKGSEGYWAIDGKKIQGFSRDYTGYRFYNNFRVIDTNRNVNSYFCKGNEPYLSEKVGPTKGSKTTTVGMGDNKILRVGSTGEEVKKVQNKLSSNSIYGNPQTIGGNPNCGNDINSCDGKFGRGTEQAVKLFQEKMKKDTGYQNLKVDGIVGDETWQQLFGGFEMEDLSKYKKKPEQGKSRVDFSTGDYVNQRGVRSPYGPKY